LFTIPFSLLLAVIALTVQILFSNLLSNFNLP
jgi:hypothetical protein